jgi:hypothetical protein
MKFKEKSIEFDFSNALSATQHDKTPGDGNTVWKSVDFRIGEADREVLIEVKDYSNDAVPDRSQQEAGAKFGKDLSSTDFRFLIEAKFTGTVTYLAWKTPPFQPRKTLYVVLIDSSTFDRAALLGTLKTKLEGTFAKTWSWPERIDVEVIDFEGFNRAFPNYPAVRV